MASVPKTTARATSNGAPSKARKRRASKNGTAAPQSPAIPLDTLVWLDSAAARAWAMTHELSAANEAAWNFWDEVCDRDKTEKPDMTNDADKAESQRRMEHASNLDGERQRLLRALAWELFQALGIMQADDEEYTGPKYEAVGVETAHYLIQVTPYDTEDHGLMYHPTSANVWVFPRSGLLNTSAPLSASVPKLLALDEAAAVYHEAHEADRAALAEEWRWDTARQDIAWSETDKAEYDRLQSANRAASDVRHAAQPAVIDAARAALVRV